MIATRSQTSSTSLSRWELSRTACPRARRRRAGAGAADLCAPLGRPHEPAGDLDESRLAGPVRAEQPDELSFRELEVDVVERADGAVALAERADGERRRHGPSVGREP